MIRSKSIWIYFIYLNLKIPKILKFDHNRSLFVTCSKTIRISPHLKFLNSKKLWNNLFSLFQLVFIKYSSSFTIVILSSLFVTISPHLDLKISKEKKRIIKWSVFKIFKFVHNLSIILPSLFFTRSKNIYKLISLKSLNFKKKKNPCNNRSQS